MHPPTVKAFEHSVQVGYAVLSAIGRTGNDVDEIALVRVDDAASALPFHANGERVSGGVRQDGWKLRLIRQLVKPRADGIRHALSLGLLVQDFPLRFPLRVAAENILAMLR